MNSLSWFLYLTDVVGNIGITFSLAGIGIIVIFGIRCFVTAMHNDLATRGEKITYPSAFKNLGAAVALLLISSLMPSKNTMYAIAASEVGEQVVKSEAIQGMASDAQKALQQWIKRQIEPEAKK